MIHIKRISGESLSPHFHDGDYAIAIRYPKKCLKTGHTIIADHPKYGRIIKRILAFHPNHTVTLTGTHPSSVTPEQMGVLPLKQCHYRVIYRIAPSVKNKH